MISPYIVSLGDDFSAVAWNFSRNLPLNLKILVIKLSHLNFLEIIFCCINIAMSLIMSQNTSPKPITLSGSKSNIKNLAANEFSWHNDVQCTEYK